MTDAQHTQPGEPTSMLAARLDTTAGSAIHAVFGALVRRLGDKFARIVLYVGAIAITYVPLLIGAKYSHISLLESKEGLRLPFLHDFNAMFMFLVSFPCLLILAATDHQTLVRSLESVQSNATIEISDAQQGHLAVEWSRCFRAINLAAQVIGLIVGGVIAYINYRIYARPGFGFWITLNDELLTVGYFFLFCILLFYAVVTVYVIRNFAISMLLRDVVANGEVHLLPLHPDKAGGLLPIGRLGLRNQYALSVFGVNVVLMATISIYSFGTDPLLVGLIVAAVVAYLVVGPAVFMAPLLPFRSAMLKTRNDLMSGVAQQLRTELDRVRKRPPKERISKEDGELIEGLRNVGAVIDELPIWPFDAVTLRKFFTAYAIPIITAGLPIAKKMLEASGVQLPF